MWGPGPVTSRRRPPELILNPHIDVSVERILFYFILIASTRFFHFFKLSLYITFDRNIIFCFDQPFGRCECDEFHLPREHSCMLVEDVLT